MSLRRNILPASLPRMSFKRFRNQSGQASVGMIVGAVAAVVAIIVAFIVFIGFVTSWHGCDPGVVCVVQEGGPFDGRNVAKVRQGGEGVANIGIWNHQRNFPATQRNYIVSRDAAQSDSKTSDVVEVPTLDAVNVFVEGQALFSLNTSPQIVTAFYKKYGVRTFNGKHPYEGDEGWSNFLQIQFRPVLENALRQAIGSFNCTDLNNTCQYVTNAQEAVKGNVKVVANSQNINAAQDAIQKILQADLNSTLGGNYFENIRFRLRGVSFEDKVQAQITAAQTKRTEVATQQLEASRQVAEAEGQRQVAVKQAASIRLKAQSYKSNPAQADIDKLHALCGPGGCTNIQVIGGSVTKLLK